MTQNFLKVPTFTDNQDEQNRLTANAINNILDGKLNSTGSLTLGTVGTTTTITDARIGVNSVILLMPTTVKAAEDMDNIYFTGLGDGTATVNHTHNSHVRTYKYVIIG
tara:strand:+ start:10603 stop:10926 length:324 start_codon:yes stop_codon:yes gene_type:complete